MAAPLRPPPPGAQVIRGLLTKVLGGFDPTGAPYLDAQGNWKNRPRSLRDRISSELWFGVWRIRGDADFDEQLNALIRPVVSSPAAWAVALNLSSRLSPGAQAARRADLVVAETIYRLIEYAALDAKGHAYTAEWDYAGRREKDAFARNAARLLDGIARPADQKAGRDVFLCMLADSKSAPRGLFAHVSETIAEEEGIRWKISSLKGRLRTARAGPAMEEHSDVPLGLASLVSQGLTGALLRPCMELLADPDLDIASGLKLEASDVLGRLKDIRSLDSLLAALDAYGPQYTHLRSNLIFAAGNLRHGKAVAPLISVLEGPDYAPVPSPPSPPAYREPLAAEKCEALWALGKLARHAVEALPTLAGYSESTGREIQTYAAWATGRIGRKQKELSGGVDPLVLTVLIGLLTSPDAQVFEEAACGLRALGLPDFIHSLHLHDLEKMPILCLKPSSTGLYELSESLIHLISLRTPVVMAVTGDSGTGKTYFCRSITDGFSGTEPGDILYLMRDKTTDKTLDRIVGIEWLRKHVEQRFYEDYPVSDDKDDPDLFFREFMEKHAGKKLIILDGWRDEAFFNKVLHTFYEKGHLDVLVRFQTTASTRRANLEEREGSLESVKNHLRLVEDPAIEETAVYREGAVLIYNLDNSIQSRLDRGEIREVFGRRKVDTWPDQVRIGEFKGNVVDLPVKEVALKVERSSFIPETTGLGPSEPRRFKPEEITFSRSLNDDLVGSPNLLQAIELGGLAVNRIAFYNQGQIAYCGHDGTVGVLTGFTDRLFYAKVHTGEVEGAAVLQGSIYSIGTDGALRTTSFRDSTTTEIGPAPGAVAIGGHRSGLVVTGHADGTIRLWDMQAGCMSTIGGHRGAVLAVAVDRSGKVYSGGEDGDFKIWDLAGRSLETVSGHRAAIRAIGLRGDGCVVTGSGPEPGGGIEGRPLSAEVRLIDPKNWTCRILSGLSSGQITTVNVYFDGRVFAGFAQTAGSQGYAGLLVADPSRDSHPCSVLDRQEREVRSCVTMGPRLVTSGRDCKGGSSVKVWGTATYVAMEHDKLALLPETMGKPPYYRSLF
jgi:WD40 repeat protein